MLDLSIEDGTHAHGYRVVLGPDPRDPREAHKVLLRLAIDVPVVLQSLLQLEAAIPVGGVLRLEFDDWVDEEPISLVVPGRVRGLSAHDVVHRVGVVHRHPHSNVEATGAGNVYEERKHQLRN